MINEDLEMINEQPLFSRNNIIKLDMSKFAKQTRDNI
jgi:hypothetical protein